MVICVAALEAGGCSTEHPGAHPNLAPLTAAELTDRTVLGSLGLPLGTVANIRATLISGDELHEKGYSGKYLLRVNEVDGRTLPNPQVLEFSGFGSAHLARDPFELYEMKTGQKAGQLDSDQIRKLEKGHVGKEVRLAVYETGGFSGLPHSPLPPGALIWQDHAWAFSTWLIVLAEH